HQHHADERVVLAHHRLGDIGSDTVTTLNLVITAPGFVEALIVFRIDDFNIFTRNKAKAEPLDAHFDDCRAANKNWLGDLFVDYYLDGTQNSLVFAVGVDNPLWSFFGLHEQRAHELARVIHQAHQLLTIGLDVGDRTGRNAGVHGGLGHRRSNLDDQARIEWLGNDVLGAERKILAGVGICHFVVLLGLSQFGDGTNAGQLHFLVDDGGAHVQSATENEGEAQNVIDLVGVIGTAGCNDAVSASLLRHFGADFGFRVGQCQDQRTIGHGLDHVGGEDPRSRAAQEHVGVLADICQGTGVSLLSVFGLGLFHVLFTAFVN